jgi:hypothetical protein
VALPLPLPTIASAVPDYTRAANCFYAVAVRARAVVIRASAPERTYGSIVAADVRGTDGRIALRKGTRLGEEHQALLARLADAEIHLVELDPGELEQDEASRRLARALAGPGTRAEEPEHGQARIRATGRGLLRVRADIVRAVNAIAPLLLFTLPDGQVVLEGDELAGAKSASLATPASALETAERLLRTDGTATDGVTDGVTDGAAMDAAALTVSAFRPRRVFVLITERLEAAARGLVGDAIRRKIAWYGSTLTEVAEVAHERGAALAAMRRALADRAELVLVSGANPLDPLDPVLVALAELGGEVRRSGVPAHPGSMVWVGRAGRQPPGPGQAGALGAGMVGAGAAGAGAVEAGAVGAGGVPVIGVATCAGFGKNTALDLMLARALAGEDLVRAVEEIGHGGLLEGPGSASRFPPYDRDPRQSSRAS